MFKIEREFTALEGCFGLKDAIIDIIDKCFKRGKLKLSWKEGVLPRKIPSTWKGTLSKVGNRTLKLKGSITLWRRGY